jgi:hypothetical protein
MNRNGPQIALVYFGQLCLFWTDQERECSRIGGLRACPHCRRPLNMLDLTGWREMHRDYALTSDIPNYLAMIEWMKGKCFLSLRDAKSAYEHRKGPRGPILVS